MTLRINKSSGESLLVSLSNSNTRFIFIIYASFMLMLIASFTEVYVVKFQKWGIPRAHILLTVSSEDEPICLEDVDRLISVEIPD